MKSGFFQSSQVLSERSNEKTNLYPFGKTKITLNGCSFYFDKGVKLPHEIFHELTIRISLEFGFILQKPFSHIDEIPTDYLEEMFVDSYLNNDTIYLQKQRVDRTAASLIDASIILLNLESYHSQIAEILNIDVNILFPKYINCITTKSYFYNDLVLYCTTDNISRKLSALIPFLEKENLDLKTLKQVAQSSIKCFRDKLLFGNHVYLQTDEYYGFETHAKVNYVEYIFTLMRSYCKAFEEPDGAVLILGMKISVHYPNLILIGLFFD
jgi:hypothetical protein